MRRPCKDTYPIEDVKIDNGSVVHWSERVDQDVPVTCGMCGVRHISLAHHIKERKGKGQFTGYHKKCYLKKRGRERAKSGVEYHQSGAVIFWDWDDRDPDNPGFKLGLLCSNKDKCVTPGERSFIHRRLVEEDVDWSGRCTACVKRDGRARSRTDPGEDVVLPSGSVVHWSERTTHHVPVTCGYKVNGERCGHKRKIRTSRPLEQYHNPSQSTFTEYCHKHFWDEVRALQFRSSNGSAPHTNGNGEKRRRGRPAKTRGSAALSPDDQQMKARFEEIVRKLRSELPQHKIRRKTIVDEYHAGGEKLDPSTITKRVQLFYGERVSVEEAAALVPDRA